MCKDWRATVPCGRSTACSAFTALCFLCFSCSDLVCKTCLPIVDSIRIVTQTFWDSQNNLDFRIYITQLQTIQIKSTPGGQRRHHVDVCNCVYVLLMAFCIDMVRALRRIAVCSIDEILAYILYVNECTIAIAIYSLYVYQIFVNSDNIIVYFYICMHIYMIAPVYCFSFKCYSTKWH